ncbi:sulfurtransferase TusA family protein [Desulfoferrobacter suflitae]|uniref:sulfurtransferase TusA family protein n=1 Tax=Desulfoferrobacter suflitae TaxID=2865782 RepID=UPI0021644B05|nr:sulfurtransferase TusA family protein [Desulfoferrobacter suflitae]MCK8603412.1 sulfurtransferase TusA family protein [Desulfoferrobacter suflitae]
MSATVDARGLSCPQPVLMTLDTLKTVDHGEIVILVDTDTSKENVIRAASSKGWQVRSVQPEGIEYRITVAKV